MAGFIYVPGLSRPATPGADAMKKVEAFSDPFLTGAVKKLEATYKAKLLDCGKKFKWVSVDGSKAYKILGTPAENLLSKIAGFKAEAPKGMAYEELQNMTPTVFKKQFLAMPAASDSKEEPALKDVGNKDTLYIVGHGNAKGGAMSFKWKSDQELYIVDPTALAVHLKDEGLSEKHVLIHAVMCFGGGIADETLQTVQPYAQRLATDLKERGFKAIKVVGATGIVIGTTMKVRAGLKEDLAKNRLLITTSETDYAASLKAF